MPVSATRPQRKRAGVARCASINTGSVRQRARLPPMYRRQARHWRDEIRDSRPLQTSQVGGFEIGSAEGDTRKPGGDGPSGRTERLEAGRNTGCELGFEAGGHLQRFPAQNHRLESACPAVEARELASSPAALRCFGRCGQAFRVYSISHIDAGHAAPWTPCAAARCHLR